MNIKDFINRSEAIRAMEHLGKSVFEYRKEHHSVPPKLYVDKIKSDLEGSLRIGHMKYRGRWIDFDCDKDEILAYSEKKYNSLFLKNGFIVLRLDGRVVWMKREDFQPLLKKQQSPIEIHAEQH
jgi:hypothetical protein